MTEHSRRAGPDLERRKLLENVVFYGVSSLVANSLIRSDENIGRTDLIPSLPSAQDRDIFPETLPPVVARMQHAAVAIRVDSASFPLILSGTIIDPTHVLTAGHGFRTDTDELLPFGGCLGDITIQGRNLQREPIHARSAKVVSIYNLTDSAVPDFSLIETQEPLGNSNTLPRLFLSNRHIKNDTPLFFVNYQPTQQWGLRDPSSDNPEIYPPAIYGGKVFATWNGYIVAQLGEKNYSEGAPALTMHDGGSGGSVFTGDGLFVGSSERHFFGGREGFVQQITSPLLAGLSHELQHNPDACIR